MILEEEKIIDRWAILIDGAKGRGKEILERTEAKLRKLRAPNMIVKRKEIRPRILSGMPDKNRQFSLAITNTHLKGFTMVVGCKNYGKQLSVFWYLVIEPKGMLRVLRILSHPRLIIFTFPIVFPLVMYQSVFRRKKGILPGDLDSSDRQQLICYSSTGHQAVVQAVEELIGGSRQEASRIERRSKGFLGIS